MYSTVSLCLNLLLLWFCIQLYHSVSLPKSASIVIMYSTMSLCLFAQICFCCDYVFNYVTLHKSASIVILYSTMSLCLFAQICFYCDYVFNYVTLSLCPNLLLLWLCIQLCHSVSLPKSASNVCIFVFAYSQNNSVGSMLGSLSCMMQWCRFNPPSPPPLWASSGRDFSPLELT